MLSKNLIFDTIFFLSPVVKYFFIFSTCSDTLLDPVSPCIFFIYFKTSILVYFSLFKISGKIFSILYFLCTSLNCVLIEFIIFKIGSLLYTLKGIFNNPSRYCLAFEPESSDFDFTSLSFIIAFSFTESAAFKRHICCSIGILFMSKFDSSFVYCIVFFMACLKNCFIGQGKLSNSMVCSCVSTLPFESLERRSYNKYAKYWFS